MNIFLGLIGVQEFFSFNFRLREFFFVLRPPPPPHKFSNGPSLRYCCCVCRVELAWSLTKANVGFYIAAAPLTGIISINPKF